jgi:hypothetical protein
MAKYRINVPYMLRELCFQLEQNLEMRFGIPMNAELPPSTDEHSEGRATIHFPGAHFVVRVQTGRGHYGQWVLLKSLKCQIEFFRFEEGEQWVKNLERFTGPLNWNWKPKNDWDSGNGFEGKICFTLEGISLYRLEMNASNRRNNLPTYEWADESHPLRGWAAERGIKY